MALIETRIKGPFEVFDPKDGTPKVVERMAIVTTQGRLLQPGDPVPTISGSKYNPETRRPRRFTTDNIQGLKVYSFVNAFGTPDCTIHTRGIDDFERYNPDLTVVSFSKQPTEKLNKISKNQNYGHDLVKIDDDSAKALGVFLEQDTNENGETLADEFWNGALARMVMLVGMNNIILHIEQLMDQEKQPNIEALILESERHFRLNPSQK